MCSTGHGKYIPRTLLGKIFTMAAGLAGQLILALSIVCLHLFTKFSTLERRVYDQVNQEDDQHKKIDLAVRWIQVAYRYRLYMRWNENPQRYKQIKMVDDMRNCARKFQIHRFKMFQKEQDVPKEQLLATLGT